MQRSFGAAFAIIAMALTFGFDFFQRQAVAKSAGEPYGVSQYFGGIKDRYAAFKSDQKTHDIADYAPAAPEGWVKRDWTDADVELFSGPIEPLTEEELEQQKIANEMNENPAVKLMQAGMTKGFKTDTWIYEKGESSIAVSLKFIPARVQSMTGGKQLGMMQDIMRMDEVETDFARVGGVLFEENTDDDDTHSRRFSAHIGRQIDIGVRLIGESAEAVEIMAGINFDGLNAMMKDPVEGVGNIQEIAFLAVSDEVGTDKADASETSIAATVQKLMANQEKVVLQMEEEKRAKIAQETAAKIDAKPAEKPKIRRIGGGNCSGNTFKRCTVGD